MLLSRNVIICSRLLFTFRACKRATAQVKVPGTGRISESSSTVPFIQYNAEQKKRS